MGATPSLVSFALIQPILLVIAWLFGELVRRILRRRVLVSGPTMAVVSLFGMSLGALVVGWFLPNQELWRLNTLGAIFLVDAVVIAATSAVLLSQQALRHPPTIAEQLAAGESDEVEFKSTARVNLHTGKRDDKMELVIAKTLAAFLNAAGGTLLIGVDDEGTPLGLDADLATLKQPDTDRFELWLRDHLQAKLGMSAATLPKVEFAELGDEARLVCRVTCPPSSDPVYLRPSKSGSPELWVRVGNSSRCLDVDDAVRYVQRRFPGNLGRALQARLLQRNRGVLQRLASRASDRAMR
ncbi:MAG: ATP-binding protein [Propionibacteriaceae bacterium]|nr:ATP-binding protein [Propionibacteriaceae bacterium]